MLSEKGRLHRQYRWYVVLLWFYIVYINNIKIYIYIYKKIVKRVFSFAF